MDWKRLQWWNWHLDSSQGNMKTVTKTRLYPAWGTVGTHSGYTQAINAGSSLCAHKFTIQICGRRKRENGWGHPCPLKNTIKKLKKFNFQNISGGLNISIFCENWQEASFHKEEQAQKKNRNLGLKNNYLYPRKSGFLVFRWKTTN